MRGKASSFDGSSVVSLGSKAAGNILIIGEKLRHSLRSCSPSLIRDRRYHLRSYQHCFVGREVVDWLVTQGGVADRYTAVQLMNVLHKHSIIHHVCDDHLFKDEMLFYRFRGEDQTQPASRDSRAYVEGTAIFLRAMHDSSPSPLLKAHEEDGHRYPKSFYGAELVTWLLRAGSYYTSRDQALGMGKDLVESDIIRHVTMDHHFKDERLLYHFNPVMADLKVTDLLTLDLETGRNLSGEGAMISLDPPGKSLRKYSNSTSSESSLDKNSLAGSKQDVNNSQDQNQNRLLLDPTPSPAPPSDPALESPDTPTRSFADSIGSIHHHIGRKYSSVELRQKDCPFIKKQIKIVGDSVGFGLVIRGSGPTYVQTVDPKGPSAAAGLKVKQYLAAVNSIDVLDMNHTDVAKLILANPFQLSLVVLEFNQDLAST